MTTLPPPIRCPLCAGASTVLNQSHPGYQAPASYAIAECATCDVQFALPLEAGGAVYDLIYEHADTLPGYSRYAWYASQVAARDHPLDWLAGQEEMYAFIAAELGQRGPTRTGQVLEVGSGLGYLTASLHAAGYRVRGLDLSARAVESARARFGDLYAVHDVSRADPAVDGVDVVVMTEVLEHVTDPVALLASLARLLKPGGMALITTPNKSAAPRDAYWLTDNPPVHLWWFSETTLRQLAGRAGLRVSFGVTAPRAARPVLPPYFDEAGAQVHPSPLLRSLLRRFPTALHAVAARLRARRQSQSALAVAAERHGSMCVVLRRPDIASSDHGGSSPRSAP